MLKSARVLVFTVGMGLLCLGWAPVLLGAGLALVSPEEEQGLIATLGASLSILGLALGAALAWQGWNSLRRRSSGLFRSRPPLPFVLLFALVVAAGQAIRGETLPSLIAFPFLHVAATTLPPCIVVAAIGRNLPGSTRWRDVILQFSSGALLSTSTALAVEIGLAMAVIGLLAFAALSLGNMNEAQSLLQHLHDPSQVTDPALLAQAASTPAVWALLLLLAAVAIPLIEEAAKSVGIALMSYRRLTLADAFLWGLTSGAGFAATEALLSTLIDLDAWGPMVLMRAGTTMVHCLAGALTGLAWFEFLARQRWLRGLALYGAGAAIHGGWNAISVVMALLRLRTGDTADLALGLHTPAGAALKVGLATLALGAGLSLATLASRVRRQTEAATLGTP